ncbi:MAG TPA: YihY/virulence factor BrkB family protein, partial [Flavobacteriales bacterium]|nr:YihY/virulence factor BrkB family protein [Flavobacteriales bacterium]
LSGFSSSYHVTLWHSPLKQRLLSLGLMFVLTLLCVAATGLSTASSWLLSLINSDGYVMGHLERIAFVTARWSITVLLVLCAVSLLYFAGAPGAKRFKLVTPGAILTLVLVFALSRALAYFFAHITDYNALYGSIGAILAVQIWIYLNMIVLLIGFELNTSISMARSLKQQSLRRAPDPVS